MNFERCEFTNCALSLTTDVNKRSMVRDILVKECSANGCTVGPAIFHNVTVETLRTNDLLIVWGALFSHVKLVGEIGKLKLNTYVHHVDRRPEIQKPFDDAREKFYASTDWALDISEARFREFEFRGIPARLVRRDPSSQVVVTRERAMRHGWRERLSASNTLWPFMIQLFLKDGDADMVLVAPLAAAKAKRDVLLAGLRELRELGVAEPD